VPYARVDPELTHCVISNAIDPTVGHLFVAEVEMLSKKKMKIGQIWPNQSVASVIYPYNT